MPLQELGQRGDSAALVGRISSSGVVEPFIARSRSFRAREAASFRVRDYSIRVLNVLMASLLILFFLPIMLLIALLVGLTSRGPIIYAQDRVGLDARKRARRRGPVSGTDRRSRDWGGRIFNIYKFRTMKVDGDGARQVWASEDDPRVTRIGRFLRAHRLDELPQLFNVLKGDMNLVGPRPEQPEIFQELRRAISVYPERQQVRPGITGWAQVNHRYDMSEDDVRRKLRLDLEYVRRRSVTKDVLIMAKTPSVMIFRSGAQ
jgi:lipopolysaccharide/colanic/teichoic acid biosynthesis glycosyltransferase